MARVPVSGRNGQGLFLRGIVQRQFAAIQRGAHLRDFFRQAVFAFAIIRAFAQDEVFDYSSQRGVSQLPVGDLHGEGLNRR